MIKFLILVNIFLSFSLFAQVDCGASKDDSKHSSLRWYNVLDYKINSSYADINGIFCVGFDSFNHVKRFHYRDDQGLKVYKTIEELGKKDIVFFKQSDFPRAAQYVTRSTPPLTLKITKISHTQTGDEVVISVKFLRNVGKGFSAADIRELLVDYKLDGNQTSYKGLSFTKMYLDISNLLVVSEIFLYDNSSHEKTITTKYLRKVSRNY